MARTFNGSSDTLSSASSINLSGTAKITLAFWLWWDAFGTDDDLVFDFGVGSSAGGFTVDPNASGSTFDVYTYEAAGANTATATFTRPSAAAWHHYVINFDRSAAGDDIPTIYVDGSGQTLNKNLGNPTGNFGNLTLWCMSRSGSSLFGAGRLAEVAIWSGINFSQTDVDALYNAGSGALATGVQSGSLAFYWKVCGTTSPEPATTGGVDLTVTGATTATHPISTCSATNWGALLGGQMNRLVLA